MEYRSKQSYRTHYYNSLFIGSTCIYPTAPIQPLPVLYLQIPYPYFFSFFLNTLKNSVNEKSGSSIIGIESRICLLFPTNNKGSILYGKFFLTSGIHIFSILINVYGSSNAKQRIIAPVSIYSTSRSVFPTSRWPIAS